MDSLLPMPVSAFVDCCYKLGFPAKAAEELESFWYFMGPADMTPDDFAGALLRACPCIHGHLSPLELMHRRGAIEDRSLEDWVVRDFVGGTLAACDQALAAEEKEDAPRRQV